MAPDRAAGVRGEHHPSPEGGGEETVAVSVARRPRRRWRWLVAALVVGVLAGTLVVTAEAWADHGARRCAAAQRFPAEGNSWRTGALAAASCQAWRRIHRHQHRLLTRLDRDGRPR